jgi:hypothetical protein
VGARRITMMFERTDEYTQKLFEQALFDEKRVITDAEVVIRYDPMNRRKLKAYCVNTRTYLQFPRALRRFNRKFIADVVEVIRDDGVRKYYRAMKGSIREEGSNEVLA